MARYGTKTVRRRRPWAVIHPLRMHLRRVTGLRWEELMDGYGRVELPHALVRLRTSYIAWS